ncbi:MAG: nucleotide sugar dehydrogenase [Acidimicrobiales bacterium]
MRVSIFGLGYVGAVSAACLADSGHTVIGVDLNPNKVDTINAGRTPVLEDHLPKMIAEAVADGRLRATLDGNDAVLRTDISLLCVGTPSRPNGDIDTSHIIDVAYHIGSTLRHKEQFHTITIRSTVFPGTADRAAAAIEEASGKRNGVDFAVTVNPEFLREGQGVDDFRHPPLVLIGGTNSQALDAVAALYDGIPATIYREPTKVAEMIKYANNSFHATKITFANEIGNLSKAMGIDSHRVMELVCADTKLNISPAYLRPGFAFGGSCLPKDVRALEFRSKSLDIETPMLSSLLESNRFQVRRVIDLLIELGEPKIGFCGLAFKSGTDDLRESPIVEVIERMLGKGFDCRIYDPEVSTGKLIGSNRDFIEQEIPHLDKLLTSTMQEVIEHADVIVVANNTPEYRQVLDRRHPGQRVVDLARIVPTRIEADWYEGLCW